MGSFMGIPCATIGLIFYNVITFLGSNMCVYVEDEMLICECKCLNIDVCYVLTLQ